MNADFWFNLSVLGVFVVKVWALKSEPTAKSKLLIN